MPSINLPGFFRRRQESKEEESFLAQQGIGGQQIFGTLTVDLKRVGFGINTPELVLEAIAKGGVPRVYRSEHRGDQARPLEPLRRLEHASDDQPRRLQGPAQPPSRLELSHELVPRADSGGRQPAGPLDLV